MLIAYSLAVMLTRQVVPAQAKPKVASAPVEAWPDLSDRNNSEALLAWPGWKYKANEPLTWNLRPVGYVRPEVTPSEKPIDARLKVYLVTTLYEEAPRLQRLRMLTNEVAQVKRALEQVPELIANRYLGIPKLKVDIEQFDQPVYVPSGSQREAVLRSFLSGRENGFGYQPDDAVFRGPYVGRAVILPEFTPQEAIAQCVRAFDEALESRQKWLGVPKGDPTPDKLRSFLSLQDMVDGTPETQDIGFQRSTVKLRQYLAPATSNIELSLLTDPVRGQVLHYFEKGGLRRGGFDLPRGREFGERLSFWVKTESKEPIFLVLGSEAFGSSQRFAIGLDRSNGLSRASQLDFRNDGTWQRVIVDVPAKCDAIRFEAGTGGAEKLELKGATFDFSDFEFVSKDVSTSPTKFVSFEANLGSLNPVERQLGLGKWMPGQSLTEALKLLQDPDDDVRIQAIRTLSDTPEARQGLDANVFNIDPFIGAAAVTAVSKRDDPQSLFLLKRALSPGPGFRRIRAAERVGQVRLEEAIGDLSSLAADPNPMVRAAGVRALGNFATSEAGKLVTVFLSDGDPHVRRAAVEAAPADQEFVAKRLLYSLVNDPSDLVRASAALRLSSSKDPDIRRDAWKAVRDDSAWARALFVSQMDPAAPEFESAADVATADPHPLVRAALALRLKSAKMTDSVLWTKLKADRSAMVREQMDSSGVSSIEVWIP